MFTSNFSGGERQRLGIARLFLKHPDVVLIDEGTSALDALTEGHIRHNIEREFPDSTVIIIAQVFHFRSPPFPVL